MSVSLYAGLGTGDDSEHQHRIEISKSKVKCTIYSASSILLLTNVRGMAMFKELGIVEVH